MARLQETGRQDTGNGEIGRQHKPSSTNKQEKSPKGAIKIESDKGWLRLRFSHLGKRYAFAVGLPDTSVNRKYLADKIARQIELDILSGYFDPSLARYKPPYRQSSCLDGSLATKLKGFTSVR